MMPTTILFFRCDKAGCNHPVSDLTRLHDEEGKPVQLMGWFTLDWDRLKPTGWRCCIDDDYCKCVKGKTMKGVDFSHGNHAHR
jgi:hypothetical protein